jgi:hypothetical protein
MACTTTNAPYPPMKLIYTLQPGEVYKFWNGRIVVAHPDRPPKIVHADGTSEVIAPVQST